MLLFQIFAMNCLDDTYLKHNLVAFVSDGASTMLAKISGVGIQLQKKYLALL